MTRNKLDKKIPVLEPFFENILICNDKNLRPFIEVFVYEPENVSQQRLGTLFGVFEVADDSEDSSYIVNYLISVIKKEYFSKPKMGPVESFEAALHKANLALSKLAEHESIGWIGKFNAIAAVIEKNSIHISQSGTTNALLLRAKTLTDISEGLADQENEPNPMKTFVNITSGRLENEDKLIIATENIFDIFSLEEIKKSAIHFSQDEFVQFMRTALVNELDKSAVLVIDIKEKEEAPAPVPGRKNEEINAFSQSAFYQNNHPRGNEVYEDKNPKEAAKDEKPGEKSGHLYIKETGEIPEKKFNFLEYWIIFKENSAVLGRFLKRLVVKAWQNTNKLVKKVIGKTKIAIANFKEKQEARKISRIREREIAEIEKAEELVRSKEREERLAAQRQTEKETGLIELKKETYAVIEEKIPFEEKKADERLVSFFKNIPAKKEALAPETASFDIKKYPEKLLFYAKNLIPNFSRARSLFSQLNYRQKIYAFLIILAIFVVPIFINKFSNGLKSTKEIPPVEETKAPVPLEQDKNVSRIDNLNQAYSGSNIIASLELNSKVFAVAEAQIVNLETKETYPLPADFGKIDLACGMDDLNLIFLLNKNTRKIISWSPTSKKFQNNNIDIPADSNVMAAGIYLTYLYLVDSKNNQIYRYPRAEGGFGTKANWKKDDTNLAKISGMAINENLFVADGNNILKFYRGKKQDFMVETTTTPIKADKLYTKKDNANLYVLDRENARIIKLDASGKILGQYYHPEIGEALGFAVNEPAGTVYFSSPDSVQSFQLQ